MARKTRTIFFITLVVLFLLVAPSTVLYSWGYRFDFESRRITQTGGFYFKVLPKSVQILLDGKPIKRTDFFFGAAFIDNLLPKTYELELKKEGYHSWKKILEIKEKQVTDAKSVVLLPQNPELSILSKNVEEFFVGPDQKRMILKEAGDKEWTLKLLELETNVKSHLADQKDLATSSPREFVESFFEIEKTEVKEKDGETEEGQLSPDQRKLAYFSDSEVWVLFLKEEWAQPQKSPGERLLIARFSEKIGSVSWLTSHYLIFTAGDKIKIAEIDDRDKINIIDFSEFKSAEIFFSHATKKLYILSQGNLYTSDKLLP
jgi:hypothetical protein